MNLAGLSVFFGLLALALYTMPWGLLIVAGLLWMMRKS